jgi:hypothetical protein
MARKKTYTVVLVSADGMYAPKTEHVKAIDPDTAAYEADSLAGGYHVIAVFAGQHSSYYHSRYAWEA